MVKIQIDKEGERTEECAITQYALFLCLHAAEYQSTWTMQKVIEQ